MTTKTITKTFEGIYPEDVIPGDKIVCVDYGAYRTSFDVDREVEVKEIPFGTIVQLVADGRIAVNTKQYGWVRTDHPDRWSHWNDEVVGDLIDDGRVVVLFTPPTGRSN